MKASICSLRLSRGLFFTFVTFIFGFAPNYSALTSQQTLTELQVYLRTAFNQQREETQATIEIDQVIEDLQERLRALESYLQQFFYRYKISEGEELIMQSFQDAISDLSSSSGSLAKHWPGEKNPLVNLPKNIPPHSREFIRMYFNSVQGQGIGKLLARAWLNNLLKHSYEKIQAKTQRKPAIFMALLHSVVKHHSSLGFFRWPKKFLNRIEFFGQVIETATINGIDLVLAPDEPLPDDLYFLHGHGMVAHSIDLLDLFFMSSLYGFDIKEVGYQLRYIAMESIVTHLVSTHRARKPYNDEDLELMTLLSLSLEDIASLSEGDSITRQIADQNFQLNLLDWRDSFAIQPADGTELDLWVVLFDLQNIHQAFEQDVELTNRVITAPPFFSTQEVREFLKFIPLF